MALVEGEKGESKLSGRIKAKKLGSRRFFKAKSEHNISTSEMNREEKTPANELCNECNEDSQDRILQREEMTLADQSQSSHNIVGNQQLINSCGEHTVHTKDKKKKERKQLLQREEQDDLRDVTPAGDLSRVTWLNHP
ncbi:predicted protein [Histoplasma capsulatum G186AR]|uniref:Uncharacterized protein n=1 Tax=Ajellomyces capsulatus (strain G186AR / H82 / ATCC MYA-2454 / RMSCC 2432) TaxID=447093 RepID=C0NET2_AJECG|nr:uncharacterized protein HCBG_01398 [Histoplasma capsulatum G186AR]EEH09753.1 predicted protein [Histoplasma capsulatum G186AR]